MRNDQIRGIHTFRAHGWAFWRVLLIAAIPLTLGLAIGSCGDGSGGGDTGGEQAPVIAPIGERTVVLGSDLLISISATDPEGAPVILSASGLPENSYFLTDSGLFCLFADREEQVGQPIQVTFTASDGSLTSSETVNIHVVRPNTAEAVALGTLAGFTLEPVGDHGVPPDDTLTLQLSASGASPIEYRMFPEPALAPFVSLDPNTGEFHFSPTEAQAGKEFEITFQACQMESSDCSDIVQAHETVHLTAEAEAGSCEATRAAFEASLPTPAPTPGRYVVQLVNESDVTLLAASNAAHREGGMPKSVLPREGTWVLPPKGVLTIDIPEEWENTRPKGSSGPVIWARTGCRYDIARDIAQCETGDCGGVYDCSKANLSTTGPKSLAEWTFKDANDNAAPDISTVDGVNISMDIVPLQPYTEKANPPNDPKTWLNDPTKRPLMKCGEDRRKGCPDLFALKRKQLTRFIVGSSGAEDVIACFSNCGQYKFSGNLKYSVDPLVRPACPAGFRCAGEPPFDCDPDISTEKGRACFYWLTFCCAVPKDDPQHIYGDSCPSDATCRQHGSCWDKFPSPTPGVCACKAFNKKPDCDPNVCTLPYSEDKVNQPKFGLCSELTDKTGRAQDCIGDDFFHEVMPRGLTWPNDPQTYYSDAKAFRIVFSPGGNPVSIATSGEIPSCSSLPTAYRYKELRAGACADDIAKGAIFAGARVSPPCTRYCSKDKNTKCRLETDCSNLNKGTCSGSDCIYGGCSLEKEGFDGFCNSWECFVKAESNGVLCRWDDTGTTPTPTATSGAPTRTPTPPTGCEALPGQVLRLDADSITGLSAGAQVASWPDLSGRGNAVSQTDQTFQPSWQPSTLNGHATVRFGANGPSALTRATSIITGSAPRTVLIVANRTVAGNGQTYLDLGSTAAGNGALYLFSPEYSLRLGNGGASWTPGAPVGTARVLSLVQGGTEASSIVLYENGAPKPRASLDPAAINTSGGTTVGQRASSDLGNRTWALHGDIATVLVFNRALTTAERCACEQQLGQRYGLSVPACNS